MNNPLKVVTSNNNKMANLVSLVSDKIKVRSGQDQLLVL